MLCVHLWDENLLGTRGPVCSVWILKIPVALCKESSIRPSVRGRSVPSLQCRAACLVWPPPPSPADLLRSIGAIPAPPGAPGGSQARGAASVSCSVKGGAPAPPAGLMHPLFPLCFPLSPLAVHGSEDSLHSPGDADHAAREVHQRRAAAAGGGGGEDVGRSVPTSPPSLRMLLRAEGTSRALLPNFGDPL